jgi:Tetratricopeptide repeat
LEERIAGPTRVATLYVLAGSAGRFAPSPATVSFVDAVLLWTIVGSTAGVLGAGLIAWQVRLQVLEHRQPHKPLASTQKTSVAGTGALPVAVPLGRLPAEIRGRDALLAELRRPLARRLRRPGRTWVLAGMGGLGKSTVALAVAETARMKGWRVWWVTATDTASLTGGILEVLRQLSAPESVTQPVREGAPTAAERVWEFLNGTHPAGRRWLLIFDNADSPAVLAARGKHSPADHAGWLRPDPLGMMIVTTRTKDPQVWGLRIALRELAPLDDATAARVLADFAPDIADPGRKQARELGHRLGGLPLALHLAGSYLASPFARWHSFDGYRRALDSIELPSALAELDDSATEARATIQRTWDLSLDALAAAGRPQARSLLFLLSCYAPATPIPAALLQQEPLADQMRGGQPPANDGQDLDAGLDRLLRTGLRDLATVGLIDLADGTDHAGAWAVTVHPVVTDANRSRLLTTASTDLPLIGGVAVRLLHAASGELDCAQPADWPAWRALVPHMLAVLEWLAVSLDADVLISLLDVSSSAANAQISSGNPAAAVGLARSSVIAANRLGDEHPAILTARQRLARAMSEQGRDGEAERMYRVLLADQRRVLGDKDPDTLTTRYYLASTIEFQGRHGEAEQLHRQVLSDRQRILGDEHPDTLTTRHHLARVMGLQGRYCEAEDLYHPVLADRQRILGDEHPDTLNTRHNLASIIAFQGRHAEAEQMLAEVLADRWRILGHEHPATLTSRLRLARVIADQGRYGEAEQLCRQTLADRWRILGDEHPATLVTRNYLTYVIGLQDRYMEAEQLFRELMADQQRILGDEHPDTLMTAHNLAWVIGSQGRYGEAGRLYSRVLDDRQRILGGKHPDTVTTRSRLAQTVLDQGRHTEAEKILRQVLADREQVLGGEHPDTMQTRDDLARLVVMRGKAVY